MVQAARDLSGRLAVTWTPKLVSDPRVARVHQHTLAGEGGPVAAAAGYEIS